MARALAALIIGVALVGSGGPARATWCAQTGNAVGRTPEGTITAATEPGVASFVGTAMNQRVDRAHGAKTSISQFRVDVPIQGMLERQGVVVQVRAETSDVPLFKVGAQYVAIGKRDQANMVVIGVCSDTRELVPGEAEAIAAELRGDEPANMWGRVGLAVFAAFGLAALLVFTVRAWRME